MRARRRIALALSLALAACAAGAEVYTWTDASGRVQYADHPPKNFTGVVKRIDVEEKAVAPAALPPAAPLAAGKEPPASVSAPPGDILAKRRADRERLTRALDAARAKLAAARQALADGHELQDDEHQVVMRPGGAPGSTPMPGIVPATSRSNCREVDANGKKTIFCPVTMPSEGYYDRVAKLEAAVAEAQEEVEKAQRAYRLGVD